jgi:hypothetical protein
MGWIGTSHLPHDSAPAVSFLRCQTAKRGRNADRFTDNTGDRTKRSLAVAPPVNHYRLLRCLGSGRLDGFINREIAGDVVAVRG